MAEYKIEVVAEGGLGVILLGASWIPIRRVERLLNERAREGWELAFMVLEKKRFLLFWQREAVLITLRREVRPR